MKNEPMVQRPIKLRAWHSIEKCWYYFDLNDLLTGRIDLTSQHLNLVNRTEFTGLLDKNGVEIYEGDILQPTEQSSQKNRRIVEFVDGSFCYSLSDEWPSTKGYYSSLYTPRAKLFKVIGNIWENGDLLK